MATENTVTAPQPTRTFRVAGDLSIKLSELLELLDVKSADYLDPLVRTQIENDHKANLPAIQGMRDARERAAKLRDEGPVLANDLGGEGG